jgi:hypothetical protein
LILALSSCSSLGPNYSDVRQEISNVDEGLARVVVLRTNEYDMYLGRSTPIEMDDSKIASCPKGGFLYFDVKPEPFKLSVETWDYPGECGVIITPKAGETYYFEIRPRDESFYPGSPGHFIPGVLGLGYILGVMAVDSIGEGCVGMFSLTPLRPEEAKRELLELKLVE